MKIVLPYNGEQACGFGYPSGLYVVSSPHGMVPVEVTSHNDSLSTSVILSRASGWPLARLG